MVEHVLIALNIELAILYESFVHNFAQVHILNTEMQHDFTRKHTYYIALNGRTCINSIKY